MSPNHIVSVLIVLVLVTPSPTWSEEDDAPEPSLSGWKLAEKPVDPFFKKRGIDDRMAFFLGFITSRADTNARVDSEFGIGTTLLLEKVFNLPREQDYPRFKMYYRFSRKHRFDFEYLKTSASGTNTLLDETIMVGPFPFELGAAIGARQDTRMGVAEYRYAFVNDGKAEAGITAGLGIIDAELEIFGEAGISPGPVFMASERVSQTIPLPVLGVYTDFTLTRRLFLSVEGTLFTANYGKYSGNVSDIQGALRWYATKGFGFGVAFNRTRLDVDVELSEGNVRLDYNFEGPSVFISFLLPGLK